MTVKEQREILEAYERGEEIEWMEMECGYKWRTLEKDENYEFNFGYVLYRIKKKRWRAEEGESYYYLSSRLSVEQTADEDYIIDRERYDAGNYFQTEEEALRAADHMKKSLKEFHNHD